MGDLPERKQSRSELQDMQRRNAFAVQPPVQHLQNLAINRIVLAVFYALTLAGAGLVIAAIYPQGFIDEAFFIIGCACAGVSFLGVIYIFWKKPRSRHHAAIIAIISLLVLVFGTVYYIEQFEQEAHDDAQGPTRY